jgi:AcrR family transcriptional regulator
MHKGTHKGEATRQAILDRAVGLASQRGLGGLSIGALAEELALSKSGLFAHFKSKQALDLATLEHAAARFVEAVIKPVLKAPRGERRVRAMFEHWRRWPATNQLEGGCFFIAAASEVDDQPGPVRELLKQQQKDLLDTIASVVRTAIQEGHFKKDVDPEQFAWELYGVLLILHMSQRLLDDPRADARAETAFAAMLERARK